jgi:hypothetical protein
MVVGMADDIIDKVMISHSFGVLHRRDPSGDRAANYQEG